MVAAFAVSVLAAGLAQAQYKQAPPSPPASANPNASPVQIIPSGQPKLQPVPEQGLDAARRITREEAQKMVKAGKAVYIDVRPKDQYDIAHIPDAISIPLGELPTRWKDLPVHKFLITYCA